MDEVVRKLAALGLPGIILLIAMATTGLTGAAAITTALAMLGPGGMVGGIFLLGVVGVAADALSKFGLEALLVDIYKERKRKGETQANLCKEIEDLPISGDLKRLLREELNRSEYSVGDRGESKPEFSENIGKIKDEAEKVIKILGSVLKVSFRGLVKQISIQAVELIVKEIEKLLKVPIESLEDIEQQLNAVDRMTGREFEEFLAKLFKQLGYQVMLTKASADYGADLVIQKQGIKVVVQVKRKQSSVGIEAVQQVVAAIAHYQANLGMVITNSKFTENAKNLAVSNKVELWDREDLKNVFKKVYN